jgi:hypothetical protein
VGIDGTFCRKLAFQSFDRCPLVARREVSVAHGLLDVLVSQQFLHGAEVYSRHDQPTRIGVAEDVRAEPFKASTA